MRKFILFFLCGVCWADGINSLNQFLLAKNNSISSGFKQIVFGSKKNQLSSGIMEIYRPNRFRWQYDNQGVNIGQQIISDGKKVFIVDRELQQVTFRDLTKTLGKSPALLLAGSTDIKKSYNVINKPDANNMEWVRLSPKVSSDNNGFQSVDMGFDKRTHLLSQMYFVDNFGGKSQIIFSDLKVGVNFRDDEFKFTVPAGYDVIDGN